MQYPTIDIIVPLHARDRDRFRILERSLAKYWTLPTGKLCIVDQARQSALLRNFKCDDGWYKQQVIKLAAVAEGRADCCLLLDADCFATRTLTHETFFDTDCKRVRMPRVFESAHARWYDGARELLGLVPDKMPDAYHLQRFTSVTPLVLTKAGVRCALDRLERVQRRDWRTVLMNATATRMQWSEYALYYLAVWANAATWQRLHVKGPLYFDNCIWKREDVDNWQPRFDAEAAGAFSVVQSNIGLSTQWLEDRLKGRI